MISIIKNKRLKKLRYVLKQSINSYEGLYGEANMVSLATDCGVDMRELFDCIEEKLTVINHYQRIIRTLNKAVIYHQEVI
ncbi:hypothetical protein G8J22_01307 [Lentilactobacillus hilgardii]|uniref:hypothetical protein n=1 Tax=Lentilactobacillus hilgardii TaxID=1588 RepID=UPI00019C6327|nr:hypothetical protein [Lentilactobacillus hilgardii]EEI18917.1 hypothetical protein HMPREF0497_2346 [Lentilactobacillus buchneri ATCC 11577]QIR09328.1 hypothetical protein G8J22_01307 [Lentilactobacillus hilgardii]